MKPLILVNFKVYPESSGGKGIILAQNLAQKLSSAKKKKYDFAVAPSLLLLKEMIEKVQIPVFSQHADPVLSGAHTGSISIGELSQLGAAGTLLNHAERKIPLLVLKKTIELCRNKKIKSVVCASSLAEIRKLADFHPDFLAYEPSELIGGNIPVTKAKPEIILHAVAAVKKLSPKTRVLCGAGIQSREDVKAALRFGTSGVLVSHVIIKAKNPEKMLERILS